MMTATQHTPQPSITATADRHAVVERHVRMLHQCASGIDGVLVVSVFHANPAGDKDAPGSVTHHDVGDVESMVAAITAHDDVPGANVYAGLQVMRKGLQRGKRGTESDIVAVLGLVADMDSDTGKAGGELPVEPSFVIETSPGNGQPAWLFDRHLSVVEAKPIAAALRRATESDAGTADVTHVWRVPGTLNWPNAKKLARGRAVGPADVSVAEEWSGDLVSVEGLTEALQPWWSQGSSGEAAAVAGDLPDVTGLPIDGEMEALLVADGQPDRSAHAARVVEALAFRGHSLEQSLALILARGGAWVDRYSTEDGMRKDVGRLWSKFGAEHAAAVNVGTASVSKLLGGKQKPANDNEPLWPGLVHSGALVRRFTPPDYCIDGIVQSGFIYGVTASTGTGKTAILLALAALKAQGLPLGDREVPQGRVVYFAGENPDDVTMRWIGAAHHAGFDTDTIDVHFVPGVFDITKMFAQVSAAVQRVGGASMVIIDTSAAYFTGDDENGNVAMGKHARNLRQLTTLPGSPCVLVACHPTKNADQSNLLPRGGGAFLAELDGNLTCQKTEAGIVKLHWQGKFRGPDFRPIHFELATVTAPGLVDSKQREIPTVMARLVSEGETRQRRETARKDEDLALIAIENLRAPSNAAIAEYLGWKDATGEPHKRRAQTATTRLRRDKLADLNRDGWSLTKSGQTAATAARGAIARDGAAGRLVANRAVKNDRTDTERTHGYGSTETGSETTEPNAFEPTEPFE